MKIVLIGIQGSGKSTQGNLLSQKLGVPFLSSGDIFRKLAKEETELGKYITSVMNSGLLIPDNKTIEIVKEYLQRPEYKNGYIIDGFPRTIMQAEMFVRGLDSAVYLKISDKEALRRLSLRNNSQGRPDDTKEAITKRIELFHSFTEPVIDYFRKNGILIEVDGKKSIEKIHKEIVTKLDANNGK